MGFWQRLLTGKEEKPIVRVGFIGEGRDCDEMRMAYEDHQLAETVAAEPIDNADEVIRTPGIQVVEVFGKPGKTREITLACLKAGIHTSTCPPLADSPDKAEELVKTASWAGVSLRVRNPLLYYEPILKARELVETGAAGRLQNLKLMLKVTDMADPQKDRREWLIENASEYLALAEYMVGPVQKVYAWLESKDTNGLPCSNILTWKYCEKHQYGYLQVDFTPGLHVRTFTQPVYRSIEITGNKAKIFINRAEGQLLRQPALSMRTSDKIIAYEMLKDDWRDVYPAMANDMISAALGKKAVRSTAECSISAMNLALAAVQSAKNGEEVKIS